MLSMIDTLKLIVKTSPAAAAAAAGTISAISKQATDVQSRYNRAAEKALSDPASNFNDAGRAAIAAHLAKSQPTNETRDYSLRLRLTRLEQEELVESAKAEHVNVSTYVRRKLGFDAT